MYTENKVEMGENGNNSDGKKTKKTEKYRNDSLLFFFSQSYAAKEAQVYD